MSKNIILLWIGFTINKKVVKEIVEIHCFNYTPPWYPNYSKCIQFHNLVMIRICLHYSLLFSGSTWCTFTIQCDIEFIYSMVYFILRITTFTWRIFIIRLFIFNLFYHFYKMSIHLDNKHTNTNWFKPLWRRQLQLGL